MSNGNDPLRIDTPEEVAAFEDWKARWEALDKEGWDRGWLVKEGYEEDPAPYHPKWAEERRLRDVASRKRAEERAREQQRKENAFRKAEAAAEKARAETYAREMKK
jgi:hypothetical protein